VRPLRRLALVVRTAGQRVADVNLLDDQHLFLEVDLTFRL
jgi:hypothetical protein